MRQVEPSMDEDETQLHYRELNPNLRYLLYLASLLTFIAGIQLYILTEHTDRYFAWTIAVPLTSAFLGANYLASFLLALLSAREAYWGRMRVAIAPVFSFTVLLLIATILHWDKFHWNSFFGWAWLVVYAVVPPVMAVLLLAQWRTHGAPTPRHFPLPGWLRFFMLTQGFLMIGAGILFFISPKMGIAVWPWSLTPLTARAVASWLVGIGLAALFSPIENDWASVKPAIITYTAVGILQAIALFRYPSQFQWESLAGVFYLLWVVSTVLVGLYGCLQVRKYRSQE